MPTILVTGSNGQLGSELQDLANSHPHYEFLFTTRKELDISQPEMIAQFFDNHKIDYCINCAAYTAVDKAESEKKSAQSINVTAVSNLAQSCKKQGTVLFHISTDYVYHSKQNFPYKEGDSINPKSVYAATKWEGEKLAYSENPLSIIIRTSWLYSSHGNNFMKTMLRLGKERESLNVVFDQIGTPTYAHDLAAAILKIVGQVEGADDKKALMGLYLYSNEGISTWYDFTKAIFAIKNINCKVTPIETSEYPTAAKRPPFSALNKAKIKSTFNLEIPHWQESLRKCLDKV